MTDTRTVIINYLDALQSGDYEALRDSFHPGASWWLPGDLPVSRTWHGRDAILGEFLTSVMDRFAPDTISFETHTVLADGDSAVIEWSVRGVGAATGEPYKNDYLAIFEVRDGRIAAVREYMDTAVMARVLFSADSEAEAAA
jgi:ketosteroid isomerase-like protein